jgi:hypothetical protein
MSGNWDEHSGEGRMHGLLKLDAYFSNEYSEFDTSLASALHSALIDAKGPSADTAAQYFYRFYHGIPYEYMPTDSNGPVGYGDSVTDLPAAILEARTSDFVGNIPPPTYDEGHDDWQSQWDGGVIRDPNSQAGQSDAGVFFRDMTKDPTTLAAFNRALDRFMGDKISNVPSPDQADAYSAIMGQIQGSIAGQILSDSAGRAETASKLFSMMIGISTALPSGLAESAGAETVASILDRLNTYGQGLIPGPSDGYDVISNAMKSQRAAVAAAGTHVLAIYVRVHQDWFNLRVVDQANLADSFEPSNTSDVEIPTSWFKDSQGMTASQAHKEVTNAMKDFMTKYNDHWIDKGGVETGG